MQVETIDPECVVDGGFHLGESPVWSAPEQALYWINIENPPTLFRMVEATSAIQSWALSERVGGLVLDAGGGVLLALASGIHAFDISNGVLTKIQSLPPGSAVALHEAKCDRQGRFWSGAVSDELRLRRNPKAAAFYRLGGEGLIATPGPVNVPNSLAWSPDGRTMYRGDGMTGVVSAWDYDIRTGEPSNGRTFIEVPHAEGMLDGAAVDAEGGYWLALFFGGCLRRYAPDGALEREIRLPFQSPTMPAFGGPDLRTLYLTSGAYAPKDVNVAAARGLKNIGGLFRLSVGVTGLPEPRFAGVAR